ncbi:MAG: PQQ-dependent sugar dehydrogenase [Actinomycetota bacterium]|nr:PQQ-dependent sugar dehydrogenase [Actinomycetota bacterium]
MPVASVVAALVMTAVTTVTSPMPSVAPGSVPVSVPVSAAGALPDVSVAQVLARGLTSPWGLAFLPDGSALVGERDTGRILRVARGGGKPQPVGRVAGVVPTGEGGLLGLAVPPGAEPSFVYAYITTSRDNRVVRMAWDGQSLGRPRPVLTGIPRAEYHDGGRLLISPRGELFIATGDATQGHLAQDRSSLAGKVLRVTLAGAPFPGNPFPGSAVYSLGHRNVQGLALDGAGRLWASEFGEKDVDELNWIRPGRNYGWPLHEGATSQPGFVNPAVEWSPTALASPSGLAILNGVAYVASLRGEVLWQVRLRGTDAGRPLAVPLGDLGRLRTVVAAPDGSLWLVTSNTDGRGDPRAGDDRILRLVVS